MYDKTMNLIDSENIYSSIIDNNLTSNLNQLSDLLSNIRENSTSDDFQEIFILNSRHRFIEEVIEGGLKWYSLDNKEKFLIKNSIRILKPN